MRSLSLSVCMVSVATTALANSLPSSSYPLDTISRETPARGHIVCPPVQLTTYAGTLIHYFKPVRIYVGFEDHLRQFEAIVRDTAIEVYGRAPRTLVHDGAYLCRRVRGYTTLLSEHALGNAIDVEGFDFGPAPPGARTVPGLEGRFSVRVARHWKATEGVAAVHARFLHLLAKRVIDSGDFRVVLGPSYPGHRGHFHLDLAPYRLVHVFGFDPDHSSMTL